MYFPYLRGKQFELKAIREFFESNPSTRKIIPLIEPVNSSNRALESTLSALRNKGHSYALIMNPIDGDFKHDAFVLPQEKPYLFTSDSFWIPAFLCDASNDASVLNLLDSNNYNNSMLVFPSGLNIDDSLTNRLVSNDKVSYLVVGFRTTPSPRIKRHLLGLSKSVIYLEDCFNTKKRNADYADSPDEPFSSVFSFYNDEGYYGFSDYTALSSEFSDGGQLPFALAIHLTYKKSEDEIYIHHFVSDTNFDQTNVRGKFHEAAIKIAPFFNQLDYITPSVQELIYRVSDPDGYPGLGYLKKLSVKNHLELISYL